MQAVPLLKVGRFQPPQGDTFRRLCWGLIRVGRMNHAVDGSISPTGREEQFWWDVQPIEKHSEYLLRCTQQKDHSAPIFARALWACSGSASTDPLQPSTLIIPLQEVHYRFPSVVCLSHACLQLKKEKAYNQKHKINTQVTGFTYSSINRFEIKRSKVKVTRSAYRCQFVRKTLPLFNQYH